MATMDKTGYSRLRLADYLEKFKTKFRAIFGENRNLDADTMEGQIIGIFAEVASDLDQGTECVYNAFNPQSSDGVSLSKLVQLLGLTRLDASYSKASIVCTGVKGTIIPKGSKIKTKDLGDEFTIDSDSVISQDGTVLTTATASKLGAIKAQENTLTIILTPVAGWTGVNNPTAAETGRNIETDIELRKRFTRCKAKIGANMVDSLYSQLLNNKEIKDTYIFENLTGNILNGVPAHSFQVFVKGGKNEDIAQVIWNNKTTGSLSYGDILVKVNDISGRGQNVYFSRPKEIPIYLTLNIINSGSFPVEGKDIIIQSIIDYSDNTLKIGSPIIYADLFQPIISSTAGFVITSMFIDTKENPIQRENIQLNESEIGVFDKSRISINVK